MESNANTKNIAHHRDVQTHVPDNLALSACMPLNSFYHLLVALSLVPKCQHEGPDPIASLDKQDYGVFNHVMFASFRGGNR